MNELPWKWFEKTGDIEAYLLAKQLDELKDPEVEETEQEELY
ncbi:YqzL family protein [Halalkalibacillus halophilus]|nr:YqzL family protein [Halalkalibacillus halophilus]